MNTLEFAMGRLTAWLSEDTDRRVVFRCKMFEWIPAKENSNEVALFRPKHWVGIVDQGNEVEGTDWLLSVAIEKVLGAWRATDKTVPEGVDAQCTWTAPLPGGSRTEPCVLEAGHNEPHKIMVKVLACNWVVATPDGEKKCTFGKGHEGDHEFGPAA